MGGRVDVWYVVKSGESLASKYDVAGKDKRLVGCRLIFRFFLSSLDLLIFSSLLFFFLLTYRLFI